MARIRTIKPEFPESESMGRVSRDARLLFVLMWTRADDEGRLRGNSRALASLLFPYDDDASSLIEGWLTELTSEKCIIRYEVETKHYIQIAKWLEHQKIDKPTSSKLPEFVEPSRNLLKPREGSCGDLDLDQGREGKGREDILFGLDKPTEPHKTDILPIDKLPINQGARQYPEDFQVFYEEFPTRPTDSKADAYKAWWKGVTKRRLDLTMLHDAAQAYRKYVQQENQESKLIATWFNKEGWTVDYSGHKPRDKPNKTSRADNSIALLESIYDD